MMLLSALPASADTPPFVFPSGCCFYQGTVVRTVVPPPTSPEEGTDDFYGFPSTAAAGQKAIVAVAPRDEGYHGGHWKFFSVTWNTTPYLLTSAAGRAGRRGGRRRDGDARSANDFKSRSNAEGARNTDDQRHQCLDQHPPGPWWAEGHSLPAYPSATVTTTR